MDKGSITRQATCSSTRPQDVAAFCVLRSFREERLFPLSALSSVSSSPALESAFITFSTDARPSERIDMILRHLTTIPVLSIVSLCKCVEFTHYMTFLFLVFSLCSVPNRRHPFRNHSLSPSLCLLIYTPARSLKALAQLRLIESFHFVVIHLHCVLVFLL